MPLVSSASRAPVNGASSLQVLGQVAGARRRATVVHAGRDAVYVDLDGTCLGVLARHAVQVPCGVRTLLPALPQIPPGAQAEVHDGSFALPGLEVRVTRIVDTTVPVLDRDAAHRGGEWLRELLGDRLDGVRDQLPREPLERLADCHADAVAGLLGLGGGLTPLGDDVLAGWLAAAVATRHQALPAVRSAVALGARARTTLLSATLLACAARGEVVPPFRSLLGGIARDDPPAAERALDALLAIGDTSGRGLLLGALAALPCLALTSIEGVAG